MDDWMTTYRVLQKKQPSCQTHCEETCTPPSPNSMLLHRFASKGLQKKQPFRFGCRHALGNNIDQGGAGGSGVMWQHVGGWLFFEEPGEDFLAYGCANTSLNQFPFALAKTSIQAHSQLQSCYPPNKDATDLFFSFMDVQTQAWTNSILHVPKPQSKHTFIFRAATHKERSNIAAFAPHVGKNWRSELCVLHGALM